MAGAVASASSASGTLTSHGASHVEPPMSAERLIDAVKAGDVDTVRDLIAADPSIVRIRDADGLSPLMLARYRSDRGVMDALLTADPDLDIFEAAALGYMDRL